MFKFTVGSCFYPLETESNECILLLVSCSMICQVVLYILSDPAREQEKDRRPLFLLSLEQRPFIPLSANSTTRTTSPFTLSKFFFALFWQIEVLPILARNGVEPISTTAKMAWYSLRIAVLRLQPLHLVGIPDILRNSKQEFQILGPQSYELYTESQILKCTVNKSCLAVDYLTYKVFQSVLGKSFPKFL